MKITNLKVKHQSQIELYALSKLPTEYGIFNIYVFKEINSDKEHLALIKGNVNGKKGVLTRVHSECLTSEVLHSLKCDCKGQLDLAFSKIAKKGEGVIIYLRQEGRGIGLGNKIKAYALQEQGIDTVEANLRLGFPEDARQYDIAADILSYLDIKSVTLMTNNPDKIEGLLKGGIEIVRREPCVVPANFHSLYYLQIKRDKMGHLFNYSEQLEKAEGI